ncbi:MAG: FAD-dependent oxidoreductase [Actinobacteria bacterium]|nr:FAD-dependent oxidoreductase [Actinomycetota bacterium]
MSDAARVGGRLLPEADVLVVGGGIVGLSCAYYLHQHGRAPVVVDQGRIGRGSSYGNGGLVAPSHSVPLPAPGVVSKALRWMFNPTSPFVIRPRGDAELLRWLLRFAISSRQAPMLRGIPTLRDLNRLSAALYAQIADEVGARVDYRVTGVLNVYETDAALQGGLRESALLGEYGVPSEKIAAADLVELEPSLSDGLAGGVLWPEDGYVDPAAFVAGLADHLEVLGVPVLADTDVLGVDARNGRNVVRTTAGVVTCQDVVVAAGAWTPQILRRMGHRVHVQPAKGYSVTIDDAVTQLGRPLLLPEAKVAVTPLGGSLRLAGTLELGGLDMRIDMRRLEAVRASAQPYLRAGTAGGAETVWRGLRALSADGLPVIGPLQKDRHVFVATGHGHIGVSLAPATGKVIAEMVTGTAPSVDVDDLRPDR